MSQEVSANDLSNQATATATTDRPGERMDEPIDRFAPSQFSVDAYANDLMDEVFRGVDHLLETGAPLPEEKPVADYVAFKNMPLQDLAQDLANSLPVLPKPEVKPAEPVADVKPKKGPWTKILLAATLLSLAGAVASWTTQRDRYDQFFDGIAQPSALAPAASEASDSLAATTLSQEQITANREFSVYLQRSIDLLHKNAASVTTIASLASPAVALPTVSVSGTPGALPGVPGAPANGLIGSIPTVPGGSAETSGTALSPSSTGSPLAPPQTVLERVYIPVYQTPQGFIPVVPGVPLPGPVTPGYGAGSATGPMAAAPAPINAPKIAVAPIETQPVTLPKVAPAAPPPLPAAPATIQTLVGVLDLGEQGSAALIEVNGSAQRVTVGEKIGNSGWTLVEIRGQEATVRRNGEVRTLFVGQTIQ
jgi:hypothetical protein